MTSLPFAPLRIEDLTSDNQPEIALVFARRAIEARLHWLVSYLGPGENLHRTDFALDVLKSHGGIDAKTEQAIRDVLAATNPVVHGRSVSPSVAAVVADSAVRVSEALDLMIGRLQGELQNLPPRTRLAYAFLALPSNTRRSLAERLDLLEDDDNALSRKEAAREIFQRAYQARLLSRLWAETARLSDDISPEPPPGLE